MSHKTTFKRRMGAALTSLATTAALIVPLAAPVAAEHNTATDADALEVTAGAAESNPSGTSHTFTLQASDDGADAAAGVVISGVVTSGPNEDFAGNGADADITCTTDATGACDITYDDSLVDAEAETGTDEWTFFVDENDDGDFDADEVSTTTTKTWHGPPDSITIVPAADSAAVGTCNAFTVTVTDTDGNPVPGETVNIIRTHGDAAADDEALTFCTPSTDGNDVDTAEIAVTEGDDEGETTTGTDQSGELTFGVESTVIGDETVDVFLDADDDDDFDAGELTTAATKTWTAGGADAVTSVDATPESDLNFVGDTHTITVTVTNAAGDPVPDVKVEMEVTDGPNDGVTEQDTGVTGDPADFTTDNDGQVSFFYTSETAGEDTILFWVDQTDGATANAHDTNDEPSDEVTKTWSFTGETVRLSGEDRHHTAVDISQDLFPTDESATNVVLARSTDYPDALAGTPLAVHLGAPMLLTPDPTATPPEWALHPVTEAEIDRLLTPNTTDTVYILGGTKAVGADVELQLKTEGYNVERVFGETRFETAVAIADEITGGTAPASIHITTGLNFPDALTAGAAAVETDGVIVLSAGDDRHDATTGYLTQHDTAVRYAIGGPAARAYNVFVSETNELVGAGRYQTAMVVVERFWPDAHPQVGVARADTVDGDEKFADALSGGTHIGHHGGPLVLTEPDRLLDETDGTWDNQSPEEYLENHAEVIEIAFLYGGNAAISLTTADEVEDAIRGIE